MTVPLAWCRVLQGGRKERRARLPFSCRCLWHKPPYLGLPIDERHISTS